MSTIINFAEARLAHAQAASVAAYIAVEEAVAAALPDAALATGICPHTAAPEDIAIELTEENTAGTVFEGVYRRFMDAVEAEQAAFDAARAVH